MNEYTSVLMAEQRHRELIREAELDRLARSVDRRQDQQRDELTAAMTHSSGKSDGLRRLVPISVGAIK